jgi:hypothetical protein
MYWLISDVRSQVKKEIRNELRARIQTFIALSLALAVFVCSGVLTGCGANSPSTTTTTTTTTTTNTPPSYPAVPPVPITWTASTSPLPAPDATTTLPPLLTGSDDFPLTVSSPSNNATVTSPVNLVASATPTNPIFFMRVYDLNSTNPTQSIADYFTFDNSINTQIFLASGSHSLIVMAEDNQGYISATPVQITVSAQAPNTSGQTTISGIQAMPGWQSCSALFPPGSARAGQICAAGLGTAQSTMTENQSSPAMDGNSAKFTMGGPTPYSNMLYFNPVAGGDNVSHFIYDLYFYVDNPQAPQALEFDINQTFGGNRWVWGSECNFNGSGFWDIWDDVNGWEPTKFPCLRSDFPANTWIHLIWDVQRVGNTVQYNTLTVGNNVYNVNTTYQNQPDWTLEEIDVAFQMDGDYAQDPYNVWLDEVNLTAY